MESPGGQQPVSGSKSRGQPGSGQLLVGPWEAKMRAFQPLEGRAHQGCHPALSGPTEAAQLSGLGAALGRHGCGHIGLGQGAGPVSAAFLLYLSLAWPHIQQACLLCGTWCPGVQDRRGAVGKAPCPQPGPVSSARPCPSSMAIPPHGNSPSPTWVPSKQNPFWAVAAAALYVLSATLSRRGWRPGPYPSAHLSALPPVNSGPSPSLPLSCSLSPWSSFRADPGCHGDTAAGTRWQLGAGSGAAAASTASNARHWLGLISGGTRGFLGPLQASP